MELLQPLVHRHSAKAEGREVAMHLILCAHHERNASEDELDELHNVVKLGSDKASALTQEDGKPLTATSGWARHEREKIERGDRGLVG